MLVPMVVQPLHEVESTPLRVLIAARRSATRSALRSLLELEPGVDLVASAGDLAAAVRFLRELRPDVVLIERVLLGAPGMPWLPALVQDAPHASIFVVGMGDHPRLEARARDAGAAGYIRLDDAADAIPAELASRAAATRCLDIHRR